MIDCNGNQNIYGCNSSDGDNQKMWFTLSPNGEKYHTCDGECYELNYDPRYRGCVLQKYVSAREVNGLNLKYKLIQ